MLKRLDVSQDTPQWLEMRKNFVGASDSPVIMHESPWKTPFELWEEKVGLKQFSFVTPAMQRGKDMEHIARYEFEKLTGKKYLPVVVKHPDNDFMIASLDGLSEDEKSIVEIKCPKKVDHELAKKGQVPRHYYAQLQHQLACCGLDMAYFYSFDGEQGCIVEVYKDASYIDTMVKREEAFIKCVRQFCPPSLCEKDYIEVIDPKWEMLSKKYVKLKRLLSNLETKEKEIREELIHIAGGLNSTGNGIKLSKVVRKGSIDYDAMLKQEKIQVNLERYRKPSIESWRISA